MKKPILIIISGHPATGKTTIGRMISSKLRIPLVSPDGIKEIMWDMIGWKHNEDEWRRTAKTSFELVYYFVEACLSQSKSLVIEAHFHPELNNARINALKERYGCKLIQIHCRADKKTIKERFKQRMVSKNFHFGHRHGITQVYGEERFFDKLGKGDRVLNIEGATLEIDTTDPDEIDYKKLFKWIKSN